MPLSVYAGGGWLDVCIESTSRSPLVSALCSMVIRVVWRGRTGTTVQVLVEVERRFAYKLGVFVCLSKCVKGCQAQF
jgi:hypothetical protein